MAAERTIQQVVDDIATATQEIEAFRAKAENLRAKLRDVCGDIMRRESDLSKLKAEFVEIAQAGGFVDRVSVGASAK